MNLLVADLLRTRIRTAGADPLITYYDVPEGQRVELSAITFGNWVAKVANLLTWEVSVGPGDPVALPLARTAPGHWMTAVWQVATWQVGAYVDLGGGGNGEADVLVCGPDWQPYSDTAVDVLACSLHPFATGLGPGLPPSVIDVDLAVRAQPDDFRAAPVDRNALAWSDADHRLTQADLVSGPGTRGRRIVRPGEPWDTVQRGIVAALLGGGSAVVVVDGSSDDVAKIESAERIDQR